MDNNLERWYSMKEIMEYLGVSRDTVLDWIERREMPAAAIGWIVQLCLNSIARLPHLPHEGDNVH